MGEYFLAHTGRSQVDGAPIGSGRYRLGSGKRPFQKGSPGGDKYAAAKLSDEDKKRIINEGDIASAYRHRRELTNNDIDAVINRYTKEKNLKDLLPKKKTGMDYVKKATSVMETTVKAVGAGINVWNTAARIHNGLKSDDTPWPYIFNIGNPK